MGRKAYRHSRSSGGGHSTQGTLRKDARRAVMFAAGSSREVLPGCLATGGWPRTTSAWSRRARRSSRSRRAAWCCAGLRAIAPNIKTHTTAQTRPSAQAGPPVPVAAPCHMMQGHRPFSRSDRSARALTSDTRPLPASSRAPYAGLEVSGNAPADTSASCAARNACRPVGVPQYTVTWVKVSLISSTVTPAAIAPLV